MPVQLPLDSSDPFYRVGVTLNDVPYILDVRWNGRDSAWYMDILDVAEDPIRCGIKLVLGWPLGVRCADPRFPRGALLLGDLSGEGRDAGIDDLGTRVVMYHWSLADLGEVIVEG